MLGIEGDWDWSNIKGTSITPLVGLVGCASACNNDVKWIATVRGRLGHVNGPLLFYVTGGGAFASIHAWQPFPVGFNFNYTDTVSGWTGGAGLEGALGGGWRTLKAEYLYVDLGNSACGPIAGGPACLRTDYNRIHLLGGGVNYKF